MKKLFIINYSLFILLAALLSLTACEKTPEVGKKIHGPQICVSNNSAETIHCGFSWEGSNYGKSVEPYTTYMTPELWECDGLSAQVAIKAGLRDPYFLTVPLQSGIQNSFIVNEDCTVTYNEISY